jgi:hypothetical protein
MNRLESALYCNPFAVPQDQVCYGMYNQATVHQYRAEFAMFAAARADQPAAEVAAAVEEQLKASGAWAGGFWEQVSFVLACSALCGRCHVSAARLGAFATGRILERRHRSIAPVCPSPHISCGCNQAIPVRFLTSVFVAHSSPVPQKAEAQLDAAVAYKKGFLDGYLGKSALAQLRAKLAANYLITPVK